MKRQTRPFIIEVKQKRRTRAPSRSIWAGHDLSAVPAEADRLPILNNDIVRERIDSTNGVLNGDEQFNSQPEQVMADPQEAQPTQTALEASDVKPTEPAKPKRTRKARGEGKKPTTKTRAKAAATAETSAPVARSTRKTYSAKERAQKLSVISKAIAGGATLKSAVGQAGISEQTYYLWKKATPVASTGGELKDLLALEEENKRLKSLLAERLRKENAELKEKLGIT